MNEPIHQIKWVQDGTLAFLMKDGKLSFNVEEMRLTDLNLEESKKRQSRFDRQLDQERALGIAISMESGLPIKMIAVTKVKGVGFITLAGLHRAFGAKLYVGDRDNNFRIKVYMITGGDQAYIHDILPSLTNAKEGQGLTLLERQARAAELVMTNGLKLEEVSSMYGLRENTLEKYVNGLKTKDKLVSLGVNINGSLVSRTNLDALRGLNFSDNLLRAAGQMLSETKLSHDDVRALVRDVKKARTENQGLMVIAEAARVAKNTSTPDRQSMSAPRRATFLRSINQLIDGAVSLRTYNTYEALQITTPNDLPYVRSRVAELIELLQRLESSKKSRSA